jgi:hypothetical protein
MINEQSRSFLPLAVVRMVSMVRMRSFHSPGKMAEGE